MEKEKSEAGQSPKRKSELSANKGLESPGLSVSGGAKSPSKPGSPAQKHVEFADEEEGEVEEQPDLPLARQDLFVCFTNDKDLRHHETISIKASLYKGIAVRVKSLNHIWMESLLFAVESAEDLGIINLRFEECQLRKRAVARLIDFFRSTAIIESLSLVKITYEDAQDFK